MTALILWVMRFIIAYWIIRIILFIIKVGVGKQSMSSQGKKKSVGRFDAKGKNVSDAEFKDLG